MEGVLLRLADPDERYSAVRLASDLPPQEFSRDDGELAPGARRAPVERLEYQLEVEHDDGGTEYLLDPATRTAPGRVRRTSRSCCSADLRAARVARRAARSRGG